MSRSGWEPSTTRRSSRSIMCEWRVWLVSAGWGWGGHPSYPTPPLTRPLLLDPLLLGPSSITGHGDGAARARSGDCRRRMQGDSLRRHERVCVDLDRRRASARPGGGRPVHTPRGWMGRCAPRPPSLLAVVRPSPLLTPPCAHPSPPRFYIVATDAKLGDVVGQVGIELDRSAPTPDSHTNPPPFQLTRASRSLVRIHS